MLNQKDYINSDKFYRNGDIGVVLLIDFGWNKDVGNKSFGILGKNLV